jgi:hypothetical protein
LPFSKSDTQCPSDAVTACRTDSCPTSTNIPCTGRPCYM